MVHAFVVGAQRRFRESCGRIHCVIAVVVVYVCAATVRADGGPGIPFEVVAPVPSAPSHALAADEGGFVVGGDAVANAPVTIIDLDRGAVSTLTLAPPTPFTLWGKAIARSGGRVAIGAPATVINGAMLGQVTILERDAFGVWGEAATLTGDVPGTLFGAALAFDGDTLLVGAPFAAVDAVPAAGCVHVFQRNGSGWNPITTLQASDPTAMAQFGGVLALGDAWLAVAAVGAPSGALANAGTVSMFARAGTSFMPETTLHSPEPQAFADFGAALAVDGPRLAIGAPGQNVHAVRDGAVYTTERARGGWSPFTPADSDAAIDHLGFGSWVVVAEGRLVASAGFGTLYRTAVDFRSADGSWLRISSGGFGGPLARLGSRLAATWSGNPKAVVLTAIDFSCEPPAEENDCDNSYLPDTCQLAVDPGLDLDGDGALDRCPVARATLSPVGPLGYADVLHAHVARHESRTLLLPMRDSSSSSSIDVGSLQLLDALTPSSQAVPLLGAPLGTYIGGTPLALESEWLAAGGPASPGVQRVAIASIDKDGAVTWTNTLLSQALDDYLGWALASTNDTLLATTPNDPKGVFPIRRFRRAADDSWTELAPFIVEEPGAATGVSIATDGARLAVSDLVAADTDWSEGRIRIFDIVDDTLIEVASLRVPHVASGPACRLGTKLRLCGDRVYAIGGALGDVDLRQARVFVFRQAASGWAIEAEWPVSVASNWSRGFDASALQVALGFEGQGAAMYARRANGSWGQTRTFDDGVRQFGMQPTAVLQSPSMIGVMILGADDQWNQQFWWYDPVDDCNGNGIDDSEEPDGDLDGNGILDACDRAGDMNLDGTVDAVDLGILLGRYGEGPGLGDCNDDGTVDAADITVLIGQWGSGG